MMVEITCQKARPALRLTQKSPRHLAQAERQQVVEQVAFVEGQKHAACKGLCLQQGAPDMARDEPARRKVMQQAQQTTNR